MFRYLTRSVLCFLLAILGAAAAMPWIQRQPHESIASGRLMALCTFFTSVCWLVIYAILVPVSGEARGMLEIPPQIELTVVGPEFARPQWQPKRIPLQQEAHLFIDVEGRMLGPDGPTHDPSAVLDSLRSRLDIRETSEGVKWNYEPLFVVVDSLAPPAEFLPTLRAIRDAGISVIRVVGGCGDCSLTVSHDVRLAYPGQCRLTLERTAEGWLCDGVRADRLDAGPGERGNPWKRRVAIDLTRAAEWSEVVTLLEYSRQLRYPIALLLPEVPPTESEKPR